MYRIIGTDQKEYGPVPADELCRWIADGRVTAQTNAIAEGGTEWKPLAAFPEFAGALAADAPAPLPVATFATPQSPLPRAAAAAPAAPVARAKRSGMAIASLILGILGLFSCGITALVGLILGFIARSKIRKSQGSLRGNGIALAGIIVSGIFMLLLPISAFLATKILPNLAEQKRTGESLVCSINMKQLTTGMRLYAAQHNGQFPPAATWCDALQLPAYTGGLANIFQCPSGDRSKRCHYAFNAKLSGIAASKINPKTVVLFETDGGWNLSGGPELILQQPRHINPLRVNDTGRTNVVNVALADDTVQHVPASGMAALRWNP
jgi:hypothetical protein